MRRILSIFVVCLLLFPAFLLSESNAETNPFAEGTPPYHQWEMEETTGSPHLPALYAKYIEDSEGNPFAWNTPAYYQYNNEEEAGLSHNLETYKKNFIVWGSNEGGTSPTLGPGADANEQNRSRKYPELPAPGILLDNPNLQDDFETAATNFAPIIFSLLLKLGFVIAVVVLAYQGVLWIMTSSPQKRAELKEGLMGTFVALFILAIGAGYAKDIITFVIDTLSSSNTIDDTLTDISSSVYHVIRLAGIGIAILAVVISGIGCLTGTADKKAAFKLQLLYISGGLFLLLSATSIIELFVNSFR